MKQDDIRRFLYSGHREDSQIPLFREVGEDLLLIGVRHVYNGLDFEGSSRLIEEVRRADTLLIESHEHTLHEIAIRSPTSFESLALHFFTYKPGGSIVYLDGDSNLMSTKVKYGVREDLVPLYWGIQAFNGRITSKDDPSEAFLRHIKVMHWCYARDSEIDYFETIEKASVLAREYPSQGGLNLLIGVAEVMEYYACLLRDYENIGPKIKHSLSYNGKKVVVVGASHLNGIVSFLEGNLEKPQQWREFVDELDTEYKELVIRIEDELFPLE